MKIPTIKITKNCIIRALRTFLQTAIGYILANLSLYAGGIDFNDGDVVKNALIGLAISAFSAGASAVMNLEKEKEDNNG